ncbi:hypothetical protein METH_22205 (plasmid) [Leisingera methylohalidivorans DSM 14336]|uniref:Integrase n=1 Tax=Leisingera methylohalidivorans DSM 14336 TaxID=999552 RepID=V9W0L1_9RHOB|nr:hypothetical protein METH_22205 [Leisingera methylohalidivorans DSM 14336]
MLTENAKKPKRERLTRIRIFEELRAHGYGGGYDAVRRYAATWSREEREASAAAYSPLIFDPGEAYPPHPADPVISQAAQEGIRAS